MRTKIEIFPFKFTETTWNDDGTLKTKEDFELKQLSDAMQRLSNEDSQLLEQMRFCYKYLGTRVFEFDAFYQAV